MSRDYITGRDAFPGGPDPGAQPVLEGIDFDFDALTADSEEHGMDVNYAGELASGGALVGVDVAVTPTGTAGVWVSAFYGKVTQTGDKAVAGYISGAEFEVVLGGSYNPSDWAVLVLNANDSNTGSPSRSAYIFLRDYGSRDMECLLRFYDESRASASDAVLISQMPETPFDTSVRCMVGTTPVWLYGSTVGPGSIANFKWIGSGATKYLEIDASNDRVNMALMGFKWTNASFTGKCLDFTVVNLAAGSTNNIFSFGDSTTKEVTITDYWLPFRMNITSVANPSAGERLAALMFLKFYVATADQANLDVQGIGLTLEASYNAGYLHGLDIGVNLTDDLTIGKGSAFAGKFGVSRTTGKTITGTIGESLAAIEAQISGNGVNTGFGVDGGEQGAVIIAKLRDAADVTSMLWLNLLNGTTATNAITVGNGGSGDITNLFWFVNADQGNCVDLNAVCDTDDNPSDGAIRVLIGGTEYFIPVFNATHTANSW